MSHEVLLGFLKAGLIDVGGNDERFDKIALAATDIAAIVKKNPSKTISFTLIALDPGAPTDDPVVVEALAVLEARWPTYRNAFSQVPVSIIRAVLLDGLVTAAAGDANIAVALACIARNMMPYVKASAEQPAWTLAIAEVEGEVDQRASAEWTTPATVSPGVLKLSTEETEVEGKLTRKTTNKDTLKKRISDALVNSGNGGQNPYYPHQNPVQWTQHAANALADSIADTIDAVVKSVELTGIDLATPLAAVVAAVSQHVDNAVQAMAVAAGGLERRTNLLWWREALYSPSARLSYRELSHSSAAALMALDLSNQVPVHSPASVAAFLREAVRSLVSDAGDERSINALIEEVRASDQLRALVEAAAALAPDMAGRGPLLGLMMQPSGVSIRDDEFRKRVGVGPETKLSPESWANWIYSELQALKAVQKRKPRKS